MAYDHDLADRLRELLAPEKGVSEKSMFGGRAFLIDGHLAVAASSRGGLMLRVDPDDTETYLQEPHAHPFEMRGRELRGWLRIDRAGTAADDDLAAWVAHGVTYARALPPK